jgi:tRNA nucleotidyltransferase (CCA-adding enzyme)
MKLKELLKILSDAKESIKAETPFIVGGAVRDKYLNNLSNILDIDITNGSSSINLLSEEFFNKLKENYNVKRKVMSDGHSSVMVGDLKIDFSSNFVTPDINKIMGKTLSSMEQELFSRDFTCNALLMDFDLKRIFDPTQLGIKDIKAKIIKTCLAPEITLVSNRNRVVRAIYLACKLDFKIDDAIIEFVKANPDSVTLSSDKSIQEKMTQALEKDAKKAKYYVEAMGISKYIGVK